MKKLLAIVLCLLLIAGCAETYDGPTELKSVRASREENYMDEDGNIYETLWTEYSYDIYGNLAMEIESRNDEPTLRTVYRYYDDGSTKSCTQYDLSGWFPRMILHAKYTYDDQGRQTSLVQWFGWEKMEQFTIYDDENRIVTTDFDGGRTVAYLDEEGRGIRSETVYDSGHTLLIENEYQDRNHIVRYYENGELNLISENIYDDQGRYVSWYQTRDGKRELVWRYEYGEDYEICYDESIGRTTTTGYNEDGTIKAIVETDEHDNIIRHVIYRYTDIRVPAEEETQ